MIRTITAEFLQDRAKAMLLLIDGNDIWVPKSIIHHYPLDIETLEEPFEIEIEEWFCVQNDLEER
jgi:hypothetical protein